MLKMKTDVAHDLSSVRRHTFSVRGSNIHSSHVTLFTSRLPIGAFLLLLLGPSTDAAAPLRTVALTGQPAPDTPAGVTFSSFVPAQPGLGLVNPMIDDHGRVSFVANLAGPSVAVNTNSQGIW